MLRIACTVVPARLLLERETAVIFAFLADMIKIKKYEWTHLPNVASIIYIYIYKIYIFYIFFFAEIAEMKELLIEAAENGYPDTPLLKSLVSGISEAEKCANVASQLVSAKVRTRSAKFLTISIFS